MKRSIADTCHVCAAGRAQKCYDDDDNIMQRTTHDIPKRIERWDRYFSNIQNGDLSPPKRAKVSDLTPEAILRLTMPAGMSLEAWSDVIIEAVTSAEAWPDPWATGTEGWQEFLGDLGREATDASRSVTSFAPCGREEFLSRVTAVFGDAPSSRNKVGILRTVAGYADAVRGDNAYPSHQTLADKTGTSVSTVKRNLKWAAGEGWLTEVARSAAGTITWQLCTPVDQEEGALVAA